MSNVTTIGLISLSDQIQQPNRHQYYRIKVLRLHKILSVFVLIKNTFWFILKTLGLTEKLEGKKLHHYSNQLYWTMACQPGSAGRTQQLPCAKSLRYPHPCARTDLPSALAPWVVHSQMPHRTASYPTATICSGVGCLTGKPCWWHKRSWQEQTKGRDPDKPIQTCFINNQTITARSILPTAGKIPAWGTLT